MDGLSGAASFIAVIDISAKITSICFQYSIAVRDAKDDIERVQRKVSDITHILEKLKQLLDSQDKTRLSSTPSPARLAQSMSLGTGRREGEAGPRENSQDYESGRLPCTQMAVHK
jgi:hypothetical protein